MMKIIKFIFKSLKYVLPLVVITLLIYYRAAIFLPEVNQYADQAQDFIEQKYDVSIPVYVKEIPQTETLLTEAGENQQAVNSEPVSQQRVDQQLVNNIECPVEEKPESIADGNTQQQTTVEAEKIPDSDKNVALVETEDSQLLTKNDSIQQEKVQPANTDSDALIDAGVMDEISSTVNKINEKVDQLFSAVETSLSQSDETVNEDTAYLTRTQPSAGAEQLETSQMQQAQLKQTEETDKQASINEKSHNKDRINNARQAFWKGDVQGAEKLYLDLTNASNSDPDIYGELGNVYYAQGKWNQAGKAYYEAAIRLMENGNKQQVNYLLRVIQGLDAQSADKLRQKISG